MQTFTCARKTICSRTLIAFTVRADRISKHREKSAPCTEDEWESILSAVLTDQEAGEDIEVTARVQSESQIEITFKKKIEQFSVSRSLDCR